MRIIYLEPGANRITFVQVTKRCDDIQKQGNGNNRTVLIIPTLFYVNV